MIKKVYIIGDTIQLDKFLKWAQVVSTGGEAKILIKNGYVRVNGNIEKRRSKQLVTGDVVEVEDNKFKVSGKA
ncbi:MAG: RNA-binding S4 domain-containing protein [Thermoanaerobacterales bacterium]|jgi:ribosome-associated protein|nr:RNA-binding S4 domain-containing protein [Thermoanaerobacterales bacterium]